jgi:predicted ArsR family transcriptional regulator
LANPLHVSWTAVLTDPVRLSVLCWLWQLQTATTSQLCQRCHTSDPTVRRHLEALEALGLVREEPAERDGMTPGRPARRFRLEAEAATRLGVLFELLSEPLAPALATGQPPPSAR